jgi:hypothetical protein
LEFVLTGLPPCLEFAFTGLPPHLEFATTGHPPDLKAALMQGPVVPGTEEEEIVQPGFASLGPVSNVVGLRIAALASRKTTALVPGVQGSAKGRGNGSALSSHVQHTAVRIMGHDHQARVTTETPGGFPMEELQGAGATGTHGPIGAGSRALPQGAPRFRGAT